jgi:tetratricopeptide (TPR) repeat protein
MFAYNTTLHVPLVVRFPDQAYRGARIDTPVSLVDIVPSVLQWLGLSPRSDIDGRPLPLTDDTSQVANEEHRGIYFENYFVSNNYGWSPLRGAIWNDFKFIQAPQPELYNLARDPDELVQLYQDQGRHAKQFETRFESLLANLRARGSFAAQSVELTTSDLSTLESLGYAGSRGDVNAAPTGVAHAPDPKDMVDVLAKLHSATIAMEQQRNREAVDLLIQVASSDDPANPRAVRMLAALIADAPEERPRILTCLQQARRLSGREIDIHSLAMLGVGLFFEQQYEACIETLEEVVQRAPHYAAAYRYLADAHRHLHQLPEAARNYRQAIDLAARLKESPEWLEDAKQQLAAIQKNSAPADASESRLEM